MTLGSVRFRFHTNCPVLRAFNLWEHNSMIANEIAGKMWRSPPQWTASSHAPHVPESSFRQFDTRACPEESLMPVSDTTRFRKSSYSGPVCDSMSEIR